MLQVHELVQDDVIGNKRRGLNETPVERNVGPGGTGAPAGTLAANGDAANSELVPLGQFDSSGRQFAKGELLEVAEDERLEIGWIGREGDRLVSKSD